MIAAGNDRSCNYSLVAPDDKRYRSKHVEKSRNNGILNFPIQLHPVGHFYKICIMTHGSTNVKKLILLCKLVKNWCKDVELVLKKKESSVHNSEQGSAKQHQQQRNSNKGGNDAQFSKARHYWEQANTAVIRTICCYHT
jgi:hypothetical protein